MLPNWWTILLALNQSECTKKSIECILEDKRARLLIMQDTMVSAKPPGIMAFIIEMFKGG
ncbi:MAG: hypothetical protein A6F71_09690 [Cycloclasticus sp. symbiont of Poecilosclerida sp. M]|nr:MAG: hypothetical protein A6F71_09690 [Cycloclasticus sp. symbiont of Poecilosclerida sp. M]